MKKINAIYLSVILLLSCVVLGLGRFPARAVASETTYSGTVSDKTTADKLYLSTSGGTVEIKLDGNTEIVNARFLLPGNSVTANCYTGSDGYWHASKITGNSSVGKVAIDNSTKATVKGTIAKGTTEEMLYLVVDNGTMQIKIDESTDVSGVKFLIIGKTIQVVVARGSDAYMHALSISDVAGASTSSGSSTGVAASGSGISGTVEKGTTTSLLYLNTSGGTMQIVLDLATDVSASRVLLPGQKVTVNFYRGSDAWNHASRIVNNSATAAPEVSLDSGARVTISGRVTGDTTENTLFLSTSGGVMQIKLDAATNFSRCPVLLLDKNVQVTCDRGSDEYYHAVSIIAN
ncbi:MULTISPECIES: hypothetical protein [unclassified Butyrivibrio]|uniref:hypothetical protein n=1 Tax=unclassified Butyrivibrio TaxID=2639466 RepID=UPI0003B5209C|nr:MULTISPECIES: hypothetical protein [unclassified Butyrivibrio]